MRRLNLFVKGNVDVHDSLHSCRIGGNLVWNGVNEILRASHPGVLIRLRHETFTRSDALLAAQGTVPGELAGRGLPLAGFALEAQYSPALFEAEADAFVLSAQADVATGLVRHLSSGELFYPYGVSAWTPADRQWLAAAFQPIGMLDVAVIKSNFLAIIERIRRRTSAPILIYNLSSVVPGERIHCYQGLGETFAGRVRRCNLALEEISETTGASIVDVDRIIAAAGADAHKIDALHLTAAGYRRVAEEVVRILADLGVLETDMEAACGPA